MDHGGGRRASDGRRSTLDGGWGVGLADPKSAADRVAAERAEAEHRLLFFASASEGADGERRGVGGRILRAEASCEQSRR